MPRANDLRGKRFGRLVVLKEAENSEHRKNRHVSWVCKCDCGNTITTKSSNLTRGLTQSCGCLHSDRVKESHTKHGHANSRLYSIHKGMKQRCYNPKALRYDRYGARGITVCDEWNGANGFENFYEWSQLNGYSDGLTIDRIDNNKGYFPENCRWANSYEQGNNKSSNRLISANGETHTVAEWSRITGINKNTIIGRLDNLGWSEEDSVNRKPFATRKQIARSGYRNIKIIENKNSTSYYVTFTKNKVRHGKAFKTLEEALKYRDENIEVIGI